ncbi:Crp/Fnr family transcriptional regulator [Phenylobacterium deserti]|uniref:Crp/Fnr family transcriptional regulator n=2 Tax=Phenylobacterium deserti TaxID=1914756 RepID=A0A328ASS9_9CAUL|nr:Crp/Fnr family transcriptional regulator [Phenylobacterium deserti]
MQSLANGLSIGRSPCAYVSDMPSHSDTDEMFWRRTRRFSPGASIYAEGGRSGGVEVVLSGWLAEAVILRDGRRYVFSFELPGDLVRLSSPSEGRMFFALTNTTLGDADLLPASRSAGWATRLADAASRDEEQLMNHLVRVGRLTAAERVLNLLLELYDRLERVGLAKNDSFRMPITQQVFGEALGLSLVHINRTLQKLRRDNLITLRRGVVTLHDRYKLAGIACYEPWRFEAPAPAARAPAVRPNEARSWASGTVVRPPASVASHSAA